MAGPVSTHTSDSITGSASGAGSDSGDGTFTAADDGGVGTTALCEEDSGSRIEGSGVATLTGEEGAPGGVGTGVTTGVCAFKRRNMIAAG